MAAIYQWFEDVEVILTTTLYPIETQENLDISFDMDWAIEWEVPVDQGEAGAFFVGGSRQDELIELPLETDQGEVGAFFTGGIREDILIELPPETDAGEVGAFFTGGDRFDILIEIYTPTQNLNIGFDVASEYFIDTPV